MLGVAKTLRGFRVFDRLNTLQICRFSDHFTCTELNYAESSLHAHPEISVRISPHSVPHVSYNGLDLTLFSSVSEQYLQKD
jgi:hypothetical protein